MVTPVIANPFRREVVSMSAIATRRAISGSIRARISVRPASAFRTGLDQPPAQPALQSPRAQAFLRWSRFPFVQVDPSGAVWLNDYRYANAGSVRLVRVELKP